MGTLNGTHACRRVGHGCNSRLASNKLCKTSSFKSCDAFVGAHILSGNVLETRALDQLLPDWMEGEGPPRTLAVRDRFYFLTEKWALRLPTPRHMKNKKKKNQIISLRSEPGHCGYSNTRNDRREWHPCHLTALAHGFYPLVSTAHRTQTRGSEFTSIR